MNAIEKMLIEQHSNELFQRVISDKFDFVDNLVELTDLNRIRENNKNKEDCKNAVHD